jgi:hypothetical protein
LPGGAGHIHLGFLSEGSRLHDLVDEAIAVLSLGTQHMKLGAPTANSIRQSSSEGTFTVLHAWRDLGKENIPLNKTRKSNLYSSSEGNIPERCDPPRLLNVAHTGKANELRIGDMTR